MKVHNSTDIAIAKCHPRHNLHPLFTSLMQELREVFTEDISFRHFLDIKMSRDILRYFFTVKRHVNCVYSPAISARRISIFGYYKFLHVLVRNIRISLTSLLLLYKNVFYTKKMSGKSSYRNYF